MRRKPFFLLCAFVLKKSKSNSEKGGGKRANGKRKRCRTLKSLIIQILPYPNGFALAERNHKFITFNDKHIEVSFFCVLSRTFRRDVAKKFAHILHINCCKQVSVSVFSIWCGPIILFFSVAFTSFTFILDSLFFLSFAHFVLSFDLYAQRVANISDTENNLLYAKKKKNSRR